MPDHQAIYAAMTKARMYLEEGVYDGAEKAAREAQELIDEAMDGRAVVMPVRDKSELRGDMAWLKDRRIA